MDGYTSKPYDGRLSLVKALDMNNEKVYGYYLEYERTPLVKIPEIPYKVVRINPYTVCRNSGIKDKNGKDVFEYDLLKLTHGMKSSCYGFIVWDEFYKSWKIRRRTDRTAYCDFQDWTVESVGNIILNDEDAEVIYQQEKEEDAKETFIDNSYCPSKFKR